MCVRARVPGRYPSTYKILLRECACVCVRVCSVSYTRAGQREGRDTAPAPDRRRKRSSREEFEGDEEIVVRSSFGGALRASQLITVRFPDNFENAFFFIRVMSCKHDGGKSHTKRENESTVIAL